jgi:Zn-dependent protease
MKCQKCQNETFLPFRCPYCGGYFCSEHRLPENHECPQIELARTPKEETQQTTAQKQKSYEYTVSYAPLEPIRRKIRFSSKETTHLTIATLLVIGIGLSWGMFSDISAEIGGPLMLVVFTAILTASFFAHEIAHKIAAQRRGLWAEFRLTLMGAILTLFSIASPFFKIISPGAVMVAGPADIKSMGKISIAGPATNITLSTIFLAIALLTPQYELIFLLGAAFNAWIALFNLIPFGILDGFKIFIWNKRNWALAFTASLVLTIISYKLIL